MALLGEEDLCAAEVGARPLDLGALALAAWTIGCNVVTWRGGTLDDILLFVPVACVAVVGIAWGRGIAERRVSSRERHPRVRAAFVLLAAAAATLTLVANRPDTDDSVYLNLAVSVVDDPGLPVMKYRSEHRLPVPELVRTSSRFRSLEMVYAALSRVTGLEVIQVAHVILPPLAAIAMLVAYRFLFRLLVPELWWLALFACLLFLVSDGGTHRAWGNFAFVRLHQGKGWLVSVGVPWILASGLAYGVSPSRSRWLRLAAGQVAALGCSSSAIVVAPLVALLGIVAGAGLRGGVRGIGHAATGMLASSYLILAGFLSRFPDVGAVWRGGLKANPAYASALPTLIDPVFGHDPLATGFRFSLLLAGWAIVPAGPPRRLALGALALAVAFVAQQATSGALVRYLFAAHVSWRLWWAVPLPALVGVVAASIWASGEGRSRGLRWALYGVALALLVGPFSARWTVSDRARPHNPATRLAAPSLKVPPEEYALLRLLTSSTPGRPTVIAPEAVSAWLPTLHRHPYPLLSMRRLATSAAFLADGTPRIALTRMLESRKPPSVEQERDFEWALHHYRVGAVILTQHRRWKGLRSRLVARGFTRGEQTESYEIWFAAGSHHRCR